jgi:thiol-disulfide isomerase/thioredoxin
MSPRGVQTWRLAWPALFLATGAVMLTLSALGTFLSRDLVPWIFGGAWALAGLVEVVVRRRKGRPGTLLLVAGIACAVLAPLGQVAFYRVDARRTERAAMAALTGRPAPPLLAEHLLNAAGELPAAPAGLTVLNFWATWCPPCIEEMPMLQEFAAEHAADPVRMVGATALYNGPPEEELARLEGFLADRGVTYPSLVSADGDLQRAFHVRTLPTTILLDDGRVVAYRIGIRGARQILAEAERRLGEG